MSFAREGDCFACQGPLAGPEPEAVERLERAFKRRRLRASATSARACASHRASVRPVSPSDNMGAGACIGNQCRTLPDGSKVRIVPE